VIVVKVGGGLLRHIERLDEVLTEIAAASRDVALLVVPGGGPFADAVREVDRGPGLSDWAAHWMAVLAMDQYAHLIVDRLASAALVTGPFEVETALGEGTLPVLAPYRWLRERDPLPHSWDVTSDSIAAWVADALGAHRLVLVKPPHAEGVGLVDPYFGRALPLSVETRIVTADRLEELRAAMRRLPAREAVAPSRP
jgi:aspartokinase-like uncharacterized kinase